MRGRNSQKNGGVRTLAIDVGASGIKALLLDSSGHKLRSRLRLDTPDPATPKAVIKLIVGLARSLGPFDRVSVGFPGIVRRGVTVTAPNLSPAWNGYSLADALSRVLEKPVRVANDADVQGLGAVAGKGVELVLTLGTGVGSALFMDGHLVPNLELPIQMFRKGQTYDEQLGSKAFKKVGRKHWNNRLRKAIRSLERVYNYDVLYLGGGKSKHIMGRLPAHVKPVSNVAGLLGGIALWKGWTEPDGSSGPRKQPPGPIVKVARKR